MKTRIHVNQHIIRSNKAKGKTDAPLTIKTYKSNTTAHSAIIRDSAGKEICRVVYSPEKPLSCGAHVWIETEYEVEVI